MKQELQDKLFNKYPKIFRQKDLPMQETAMCWGICVCDGWYDLIDNLCMQIQHHINWTNIGPRENEKSELLWFEATQVKEKFGGLRFYYDGGDDFISGMVTLAESMSYHICEVCGDSGKQTEEKWATTRCEKHKETRKWHTADG